MKFEKSKFACMGIIGILPLLSVGNSASAVELAQEQTEQQNTVSSPAAEEDVLTEGFKLSLTTDKSEYAVDARIDIQMALKDISHPRWTTEDAGHYTYSLDIRGSDGESVGLTAFGENYTKNQGKYEDKGLMVFVPGVKEAVPLYNAQAFFKMSKPDVYTMQATRQVPSLEDPKKMVTINSNVVKIRIEAPEDAEAAE